ncbi:hypothetical protein Cgig2_022181 [Carnegiea gigantea]|uniref:Uncharacterized protein n=1 Tax=Carnegiea gigantea TaxID=171969 RepID=A0A9Q1GLM0_9CARY|nr:hypothetical protein Cgig2_022181 [Carnegiea gigantea]
MELRKHRRGMHTEATHVSSSRSDSDDDISEYEAKEEGKDNAERSSSVMGEDEVSGSSGGCAMSELHSKKRHNKGYLRDFSVSEKSALVEGWNVEIKAFKVGSREIPFSVYDVVLLTGLPAIEKQVTFDRGIGTFEVEEVIKVAMEDHLARERNMQRSARSNVRLYRNYVAIMVELCKGHGGVQLLDGHLKLPSGSNRGDKAEPASEEEHVDGWLCDDTSDEKCVPRIASWVNLYVGRNYDATVLISSMTDNQEGDREHMDDIVEAPDGVEEAGQEHMDDIMEAPDGDEAAGSATLPPPLVDVGAPPVPKICVHRLRTRTYIHVYVTPIVSVSFSYNVYVSSSEEFKHDAHANLSVILTALDLDEKGQSVEATERASFVLPGATMTEAIQEAYDSDVPGQPAGAPERVEAEHTGDVHDLRQVRITPSPRTYTHGTCRSDSPSYPSIVTCVQDIGNEEVEAVQHSSHIGPGTQSICKIDVKGLVNVIPRRDLRDKAGDFCINGFAIDHYNGLLHRRQCAHSKYYRLTIFLKMHQLTAYAYRPHHCVHMSDRVETIPGWEEFGYPHQHIAQPDGGASERVTVPPHVHNTRLRPMLCTAPNNLVIGDVAVER